MLELVSANARKDVEYNIHQTYAFPTSGLHSPPENASLVQEWIDPVQSTGAAIIFFRVVPQAYNSPSAPPGAPAVSAACEVSNLTLMALGSSAPEILLSIIELQLGGRLRCVSPYAWIAVTEPQRSQVIPCFRSQCLQTIPQKRRAE